MEELTEKETLSSVVRFLEYILENGNAEEIRSVNVNVSSQLLKVGDIVRKYWPEIIKEKVE